MSFVAMIVLVYENIGDDVVLLLFVYIVVVQGVMQYIINYCRDE